MLDRLERKFGRYAIPNLPLILIGCQVAIYLTAAAEERLLETISLVPARVLEGEVWRLVTFAVYPLRYQPLWFLIMLYIFWFKSRALEEYWGAFRFNLYLLVGYLATVGAAWVNPAEPATNFFLYLSVAFAFSYLFPNFTLMLFFVLPIQAKWIGIVLGLLYGGMFIGAVAGRDWQTAVIILAAVANFFVFFGPGMVQRFKQRQRQMARKAEEEERAEQPFHECVNCGKTDKTHPEMEFRYCPECTGAPCYCMDHIFDHEHR